MYSLVLSSLLLGASALSLRRSSCSFGLTASGGESGTIGQLSDGQNRIGGGLSPTTFTIDNGGILDSAGRGCILTPSVEQFQCDQGVGPTFGFSIAANGSLLSPSGSSVFYACPASDTEWNLYTIPVTGQLKCVEISLAASDCGSTSSTSSVETVTVTVYGECSSSTEVVGTKTSKTTAVSVATSTSARTGSSIVSSVGYNSSTSVKSSSATVVVSTTPVKTSTQKSGSSTSSPKTESTSKVTSLKSSASTSTASNSTSALHTSKTSTYSKTSSSTTARASSVSSSIATSSSTSAQHTTKTSTYSKTSSSTTARASSVSSSVVASSVQSSSTCVATTLTGTAESGNYQYPHLIIPISSDTPDTAAGTQYFGTISSNTSTIFNFDIPSSYSGSTCNLIFLLPLKSELETSSYTFSGTGTIDFEQLATAATSSTTYDNAPSVSADLGEFTLTEGSSTLISSFSCDSYAGTTATYEMKAVGDTYLYYFQDWNPSPLGIYITVC